jgi:SAM-dependent methyltransferase
MRSQVRGILRRMSDVADDERARSWTDGFFSDPLWNEVQRIAWSPDETRAQTDEIERLLALAPSSEVLDVPCGDGRIAIELARRGHRASGVDVNASIVGEGRARAASEGLAVELVHGDMRALALPEARFDAAVCWWGSFGYFDDAGDLAFLRGVARALAPGARFAIDMANLTEALLPRFQPKGWDRVGPIHVLEDRRLDLATSRLEVEWLFMHEDGRRSAYASSMRLYGFRELAERLASCGFEDVVAIDRASGAPYAPSPNGARVAIVARRAAD